MKTVSTKKKSVAIVGGGVAGIMLAAHLDNDLYDISIYEKGKALGRKFLVAGDGGLNLTHSEPLEEMLKRYSKVDHLIKPITNFSNTDLRKWFVSIGIETFIGSSKRVFPLKDIKPIAVLNAMLAKLKKKKVTIHYEHIWNGWKGKYLLFDIGEEPLIVKADYVVFALGGGSWSVTGSDGEWMKYFANKKLSTTPFESSNCAINVNWPREFSLRTEGQAIKNITITCENKTIYGEAIVTKFGLEGGAVYALSHQIRQQLKQMGKASIHLDLKPSLDTAEVENRLLIANNKNISHKLETNLHLSKPQIALLKHLVGKEDFLQTKVLAQYIKRLPIEINGLAPIDEAISTVGGISFEEIDEHFEFKNLEKHFAIGEMLDWDAPTGGYLLQACFSMGVYLANYFNIEAVSLNRKLDDNT